MAQHRRGRGTGRAGHRTGPTADAALPAAAVRNPADGPAGAGLRADDRHSGPAHLSHCRPVPGALHRIVVRRAHGAGTGIGPEPGAGHPGFHAAGRGGQGTAGRLRSQRPVAAPSVRESGSCARALRHFRGRDPHQRRTHHPEQRRPLCRAGARSALAHRPAPGPPGPSLRGHRRKRAARGQPRPELPGAAHAGDGAHHLLRCARGAAFPAVRAARAHGAGPECRGRAGGLP